MTYWNEINDSHIRFWDTDAYPSYFRLRDQINENGYRGNISQSTDVLYLGTCDLMTNLLDGRERWAALHHATFNSDQPFIALGTVASGLPSMVRRLYAYIRNFSAPKRLYITIPRFDGYEFVNKSGLCYNVSTRVGSAKFCERAGLIDKEELDIWLAQLEANKRLNNPQNIQYILEERFAFIELICRAYNIELKWTFNPSDASIVVLYKNLSALESISDFMKDAFVGIPEVKDHAFDRSIGPETHKEIYNKFSINEKWNYIRLCEQAEHNFRWLEERYGKELIKMEED